MKQQFHLVNDDIKQNAINFIRELPVDAKRPLVLDIKEMTRTLDQNKKCGRCLKTSPTVLRGLATSTILTTGKT